MPENQNDNLLNGVLYHFSKKVLLLSLLFLVLNAAWFGLILSGQSKVDHRDIAPKLLFANNQIVKLKTPFDSAFFEAKPNQELLAGTQLSTGDKSFVEIRLEGNVLRLDENTNVTFLENNFDDFSKPRFV